VKQTGQNRPGTRIHILEHTVYSEIGTKAEAETVEMVIDVERGWDITNRSGHPMQDASPFVKV